jgi:hypothetical protein
MLARRLIPFIAGLTLVAFSAPAWAQEEKEEIEDKADPNQPVATAAGVYSLETYPNREIDRTLLQPAGVIEVRPELFIDMSKGRTFETWVLRLLGEYGLSDTMELQAGANAITFISQKETVGEVEIEAPKPVSLFAAIEIALAYDVVDFRGGVEIPVNPDFLLDIVLGLPIRWRLSSAIAILALEKILTIHTIKPEGADETPKPDLTISVGGLFQAMEKLALIVRAEIILPGFETGEEFRRVPLEVDLQYTVSNMLDLGLALRLENFLAKDTADKVVPFDNRSLALFARIRFGR